MDILEALRIVYPLDFFRYVPSTNPHGMLFFNEDIKKIISPLKIINQLNHTDVIVLTDVRPRLETPKHSTYYKEQFVRDMIERWLPRVQKALDEIKSRDRNTLNPQDTMSSFRGLDLQGPVTVVEKQHLSQLPRLSDEKLKSMIRNAFPDELFLENVTFGEKRSTYKSSMYLPKYNISFEFPSSLNSPDVRSDFTRKTNTKCIQVYDESAFSGDFIETLRQFSISIGVANSLILKYHSEELV
jgi:hypothetical protein